MPAANAACMCRSTTAIAGSRCNETCPQHRCATSPSMVRIWYSPRTAAASGSWMTLHRCASSMPKPGPQRFGCTNPKPAYRVRLPEFTGTPMPKDEPMAANPPLGAYLDYTLKTTSNSPVTLDIIDSTGALVRRCSSADPVAAVDSDEVVDSAGMGGCPQHLVRCRGYAPLRLAAALPGAAMGEKSDPGRTACWHHRAITASC